MKDNCFQTGAETYYFTNNAMETNHQNNTCHKNSDVSKGKRINNFYYSRGQPNLVRCPSVKQYNSKTS